jgi:hypothetical protein
MTCPSCKNIMCDAGEQFKCPVCKGELFITPKEDLSEKWFRSKQKYSKAMRDTRVTNAEYKRQKESLRSWGTAREDWDVMLGL